MLLLIHLFRLSRLELFITDPRSIANADAIVLTERIATLSNRCITKVFFFCLIQKIWSWQWFGWEYRSAIHHRTHKHPVTLIAGVGSWTMQRARDEARVVKLGRRWGRIEQEELAETPSVRNVKGHRGCELSHAQICWHMTRHKICMYLLPAVCKMNVR